MEQIDQNLTGKFLIAMPDMADEPFRQSLIYLCSHGDDGALGLIVNKPTEGLNLNAVMTHMGIDVARGVAAKGGRALMRFGGPVEPGRGFVLHGPDYEADEGTVTVSDAIRMTASREILEQVAMGSGPQRAAYFLGYAGWGAGQLEAEIADNGWLVASSSSDLIFAEDFDAKWARALRGLGVEPALLSSSGGRA